MDKIRNRNPLKKSLSTSQGLGKASKIILWIIGIIFLAIILALLLTQNISDVARNELKAIKAGDINKAYSLTSQSFRNVTPLNTFSDYVSKFSILKNYKKVTFNDKKIENGFAYLNGTIIDADNTNMKIEFQLIKENKDWKVQAMRLSQTAGLLEDTPSTTQNKEASIYGVLISSKADKQGYVEKENSNILSTTKKIFVTVQVIAPVSGVDVSATLTHISSKSSIGPITTTTMRTGNILKAFSFTRENEAWPKGEYQIVVTLSTGATNTFNFKVS